MITNYDRVIRVASRAHIPLAVLFEVTHRCNLGCEHCYLTEGPVGRPRSSASTRCAGRWTSSRRRARSS